jgi:hypothetical protein
MGHVRQARRHPDDRPGGFRAARRPVLGLVRFVSAVLERIRTAGEWKQLYARYIGTRIQPRIPGAPAPQYCGASCMD